MDIKKPFVGEERIKLLFIHHATGWGGVRPLT